MGDADSRSIADNADTASSETAYVLRNGNYEFTTMTYGLSDRGSCRLTVVGRRKRSVFSSRSPRPRRPRRLDGPFCETNRATRNPCGIRHICRGRFQIPHSAFRIPYGYLCASYQRALFSSPPNPHIRRPISAPASSSPPPLPARPWHAVRPPVPARRARRTLRRFWGRPARRRRRRCRSGPRRLPVAP